MSQLVVITGPIAAGKSSVASKLADYIRDAGRAAVVLDLDDIVSKLHVPPQNFEQSWEWARTVHGRLIGEWLSTGVDTVIVDGPFYTARETSTMMQHVANEVRVHRVLLLVPFAVALDRVASDPSRGVSKIPSVLRTKYEEFVRDRPSIDPCDWTFDTSECTVNDVIIAISRELLAN
jgi:shikimate kinase